MLISKLIGGLGNQMFQYAMGRALSLQHDVPLRLDISGFTNYGLHQGFELLRLFKCTADIASQTDINDILSWQRWPGIRRVLSRPDTEVFRRNNYVIEPHFQYWNGIKSIQTDSYLSGYWQSEKYFIEFSAEIRDDFSFGLPLSHENSKLASQIDQVSSVSLHIRRGDYIHNPKAALTYELCTLDYYAASIRYITNHVSNPQFFIFSDDIEWAKNNLVINSPCFYIDHNHGSNSYNEMRLMSLCKHNIIANSTFSWWGAWLNPSLEKIVIAPQRWFTNKTNTQDLIPASWVKL